MPHTQRLYQEIQEGFALNFRMDGHALSRLRNNDGHEMVPLSRQNPTIPSTTTSTSAMSTSTTASTTKRMALSEDAKTADKSTIRFECWRRHLRRGSSPDVDRAIFEFLGSQTLADVHNTIVELMEDDLWEMSESSSSSPPSLSPPTNEHENSQDHDSSGTAQDISGCFFIEGTFYTNGSVDHVTPIQQWLAVSDARKALLRISTSAPLCKVPMSETKLKDIPWRLNTRYHHVHHGDVECSIYITDQRHDSNVTNASTGKPVPYPLVHDCWPPALPYMECEACQKLPISVFTSTKSVATQGYRALCAPCLQRLLRGTRTRTN